MPAEQYNETQIQVLEGLEAVRKRPGMYIGTTSVKGLHHLVYEIVDNAVDEALAGYCKSIEIVLHNDGSVSVEDDGRGIPIGIHPAKGIPAVEVVFTILHAGGKFGGSGYKVSGGLHGVGASVVNALSSRLVVDIYNGGKKHRQIFERGKTVSPLTAVDDTPKNKTGTRVQFWPDAQIFEELNFSFDTLKQRLRETAFITKGLRIAMKDERAEEDGKPLERVYHYEGGIVEFVRHINRKASQLFDKVFYVEAERDGVVVEVAMQYTDEFYETSFAFVNTINTTEGGTHMVGFRTGLTKTINEYAKKANLLKEADKNLSGEDVREGLTVVVSIRISDPQFESQTKIKLGNSEARYAVEGVISEHLGIFLEENPNIGKIIVDKALTASRAREAAKRARELVRRKGVLETSRLPGKLTDCSDKNPDNCEIFIVEGNSAGGSAIGARTPKTQAILPLRGKIMNVEKSRLDKILSNEEIKSMIMAFGTGIQDDFDYDKLRYKKIIIMTDADVDGSHIRTLLLTFMYRYMTELIERGNVFIAQPPLYKLEKGKKTYYAYTERELDEIYATIGREGSSQPERYKGLGEMDAEQLWDTTMDPERRTLKQVGIGDAIEAGEIFNQLMGDRVEPRREFINAYAPYAVNIDI